MVGMANSLYKGHVEWEGLLWSSLEKPIAPSKYKFGRFALSEKLINDGFCMQLAHRCGLLGLYRVLL
jgi:hypothetical protein